LPNLQIFKYFSTTRNFFISLILVLLIAGVGAAYWLFVKNNIAASDSLAVHQYPNGV
jgi:flagellar basal body-associated protein FliL